MKWSEPHTVTHKTENLNNVLFWLNALFLDLTSLGTLALFTIKLKTCPGILWHQANSFLSRQEANISWSLDTWTSWEVPSFNTIFLFLNIEKKHLHSLRGIRLLEEWGKINPFGKTCCKNKIYLLKAFAPHHLASKASRAAYIQSNDLILSRQKMKKMQRQEILHKVSPTIPPPPGHLVVYCGLR